MADNLLDMAVRQLGSSGIDALSSALSLPAGKEEAAVKSGVATVLAGMLNKGSSKTGMAGLFKLITGSSSLDFSSISDVFSDPEQLSSLQESGANLLDTVFGTKASDASNVLSSSLGLSGGSGGGLLKVAAPVVISLLGRLIKGKGLDISGLAAFLLGQKVHIKDHIPDGLLKELGVPDFSKLGATLETHGHSQPQEARPQAVGAGRSKRGGFGKWFWPLLIALAALYALNMCAKKQKVEDQPGEVILQEETTMIEDREDMPRTGDGTAQETPDFATSFREYLASAARDPNREFPLTIEFAKDSAQVTSTSVPDVDALATIMQDDEGLTIAIEGHTSSEGDENSNQQLSQERADAVRQMLLDKGVDANRITATGMGSAKPVADNDTEEGKQKNRRISVRVVTFE